jgi:hypothetical protein
LEHRDTPWPLCCDPEGGNLAVTPEGLALLYQALRAIVELKWSRIWPLLHGAILGHLKS